jgi:hypothetical protein
MSRGGNRNPTGKGGFRPGASGNPGGKSAAAIEAAEKLGDWLRSEEVATAGRDAYLLLLRDGNPVIVKDYMDRTAGKASERIEIEHNLGDMTDEQLQARFDALVAKKDES